jgi:hypothetical protein
VAARIGRQAFPEPWQILHGINAGDPWFNTSSFSQPPTKRLPAQSRQVGIATESRLKYAAVLVGQAVRREVSPANCEI